MTKPAPCKAGVHCSWCRDRDQGAAFRASLAAHVGQAGDKWDCPFGVPWGATALPVIRSVEQVKQFVETYCDDCEWQRLGAATEEWPDGAPGCRQLVGCRSCGLKLIQHLARGGACPIGKDKGHGD